MGDFMISNLELLIRLFLSAIIGGSIGIEREVSNRPAGLRTHILVSVGSSLIMLVSIYGFEGQGDPGRLASQVVSGIGFLGAGTILRTGNSVKGLTTAASLWVCSGIGLAIGAGFYLGGIITAGIVLISLISLGTVEKKVLKNTFKVIHILGEERPGLIGDIGTLLGEHFITIKDVAILEVDENNKLDLSFTVKIPSGLDSNKVIEDIYKIRKVLKVYYEGNFIER